MARKVLERMTTTTPLFDESGKHVANRIDQFTVEDKRDGVLHRMQSPRQPVARQPKDPLQVNTDAKQAMLELMTRDVPPPPTFDQVLAVQRARGQRT